MKILYDMLHYNQKFVQDKEYERFQTSKYPDKKMVVFSCMDTRLVELLPQAMNIKNGDVKIIKNAGTLISHRFDSIMRSIIVAVYELGAEEICVVGHHGCGMGGLNTSTLLYKFLERGVEEKTLNILENAGIGLESWLHGFDCVEDSVKHTVSIIRNHPLLPQEVIVHGLIIDPHTGKLDVVIDGYQN